MLRFVATECGSRSEGNTVVCGASNSAAAGAEWHSIIFMRGLDDDDDEGPYFELDDQSQGLHRAVRRVTLEATTLRIELAPARGAGIGHRVIEVRLDCPRREVEALRRGLRRVFRDATYIVSGA